MKRKIAWLALPLVLAALMLGVKWENESIRRARGGTVVVSMPSEAVTIAKARVVSPLPMRTPTAVEAAEMVVKQEIQKLQVADPIMDFEKAWSQGDHRFAGVHVGVGISVPSDKGQISTALQNKYNVKIICSPGDVLFKGVAELRQMGDKYARRYNGLLLNKLNLG